MTSPAGGHLGSATIVVTADTTAAALAIRGLTRDANGRLRDLRGRFVSESRAINRSLNTVATSSDKVTKAVSGIRSAALLLTPALIPIAVQAAPIAASMGAAAVAVGVFAAAAAGQVTAMTEAADAEKKYQDAVDEHGATSKEAAQAQTAYVKQIQKMPPATRTAAAALSSLKDQYQNWSDALAGDTMPVATKAFQTLSAVFPKMTPLVQGTSTQLDRFVTIAAGSINTPGFDALIARFSTFATGALNNANNGLIHFIRTANTSKISSGVSAFMDYVHENGPLVKDTLANVMEALANIAQAAANAGPGLLTLVNAFAGLVASLPPDVITTMLQLSLAFKAVRIAAATLAAVTGAQATANLSAFIRSARFGGVSAAVSGVAQRMTTLQRVAGSLGVLAVVAVGIDELAKKARGAPPDVDRLAGSLKQLAVTGKFTGELKATFGSIDGLVGKFRQLSVESRQLERLKPLTAFSGLGSFTDTAISKLDDLTRGTKSLGATKDDVEAVDQALADLVKNGQAAVAADAVKRLSAEYAKGGKDAAEFTSKLDTYKSAVSDAALEQKYAAQSMGLFGAQAQATQTKLDGQKASADGLRNSIEALNDAHRNALGGMIGFEASIDSAAKAAKDNAGSLRLVNGQLDVNSPKAQAAATALQDLGIKTKEAALASHESTGLWEGAIGIYERGRQQFIKTAQAMGLTKDEAVSLAKKIIDIPDKTTTVKMNAEDAQAGLAAFNAAIKKTPGTKAVTLQTLSKSAEAALQAFGYKVTHLKDGSVTVTAKTGAALSGVKSVATAIGALRSKSVTITTNRVTKFQTIGAPGSGGIPVAKRDYATGGLVGFPAGGRVRGPGTGTSDSILARVSNGEYVIPAARVEQYGPAMFDAIRAGTLVTARPAAAAAAPSWSSLGVGSARTVGGSGTTVINNTIVVENRGVIGSKREVENWLTASLDQLRIQGRLPRMD